MSKVNPYAVTRRSKPSGIRHRGSCRCFWWSWDMNDWEDVVLDDVATIQIGGTPSREVAAYWASTLDSGFPWVSIADLKERAITETKERITEKGITHSNVKPISAGTLIMSFKLSYRSRRFGRNWISIQTKQSQQLSQRISESIRSFFITCFHLWQKMP